MYSSYHESSGRDGRLNFTPLGRSFAVRSTLNYRTSWMTRRDMVSIGKFIWEIFRKSIALRGISQNKISLKTLGKFSEKPWTKNVSSNCIAIKILEISRVITIVSTLKVHVLGTIFTVFTVSLIVELVRELLRTNS